MCSYNIAQFFNLIFFPVVLASDLYCIIIGLMLEGDMGVGRFMFNCTKYYVVCVRNFIGLGTKVGHVNYNT